MLRMWSHDILYTLFLSTVHIYARVVASLAARQKSRELNELLRNIKVTIDVDDWDQVCRSWWKYESPVVICIGPTSCVELYVPFNLWPALSLCIWGFGLWLGFQVLGAAINVYANKHRERPDRLIEMLSSSHRYETGLKRLQVWKLIVSETAWQRALWLMVNFKCRKVLACVVCGRLKTAFQIASKNMSVTDVQYVAHQVSSGASFFIFSSTFCLLYVCKLTMYMK